MTVVYLLLFIVAAVCFFLALANVRVGTRRPIDMVAAGLLAWVLVELLRAVQRL